MSQATLQDVARMAGVSTKTVSRVINNEPNVATETTDRVKAAIAKLHYVPNLAARSLSRGRAMAIGLVVGWPVATSYSSMLVDSMLQDTMHNDHSLMLFPTDAGTADRVAAAFRGQAIDGIIMDSKAADNPGLIEHLHALNRPHVIIHPNYPDRCQYASFVRIDNLEGAKKATSYLTALGHRAIGFVSFPADMPGNERISGYRAGLQQAGIDYRPEWVYESTDLPVQVGYRGALQLLTNHPEITAVFAATDEIAMGTLTAIWQLGLKVPEDISVMGFDDISLAAIITPPLTTIHQSIDAISRSAVELVIQMVDDPQKERVDLVLPTELIVRNSCQAPRRLQV
jgi:LacI family transcriptional regulator